MRVIVNFNVWNLIFWTIYFGTIVMSNHSLAMIDPYPSDDEKRILSQQTGLSLSQVNNWFGNKRMRYKRKMLEQNRRNGQKGAGSSQAGDDDDTPQQQLQFHNDQDFNFN